MLSWLKYQNWEDMPLERKDVLIPAADIERQREFTQKIRAMHRAREAHPTACVDTFGCQQNGAEAFAPAEGEPFDPRRCERFSPDLGREVAECRSPGWACGETVLLRAVVITR